MVDNTIVIREIDSILLQWKEYDKEFKPLEVDILFNNPLEKHSSIFTSIISTIERFAPPNSAYYKNATKIRSKFPSTNANYLHELNRMLAGILFALRDAYSQGYLQSIEEIVHAELFDDFLEMAEYLLDSEYKDASAVMVGSVLESHIKKMCTKNGLPITFKNKGKTAIKKADVLNADLEKQGVYNKLQQKQITAWLGLRNAAAHGDYNTYMKEDVDLMLKGVRQFILQNPA